MELDNIVNTLRELADLFEEYKRYDDAAKIRESIKHFIAQS